MADEPHVADQHICLRVSTKINASRNGMHDEANIDHHDNSTSTMHDVAEH